ncbi:dTDP-4-dehydrorhamnose reductase [Ancylobacter dichloromethanicus]|uniref:dTDP-4-dehydrorhamnose reductase n=1 Tax=Ancylobacter dichloromethanicus TaxID=518825 RepID=A0A9W6MZM3_9HYPH|nr:dTDP-4-dehydrorhamnose reductase [Ancylobacter dichloromethanicus]MBS7555042.1 dTDP-4-dehydrorhamnose reductase [Ancylobacter dichloromethanicus]GLK72251.1 NAD(P)-dependent oxidoreductase [Ancylobacter dichloromethanicus]
MTRLLLLGAGGQLGREIAATALGTGVELVALDRAGLDITDAAALGRALATSRPEVVINAAAYTAVDRAESEPERAHLINAVAPGLIAAACAQAGAALIHLSTDYVFDGTRQGAYVETDPVAPLGVYGVSKEAGERAVREGLARHLIVRTSWVYGIHGANFLKTMLRLAAERDRLTIVADQRGCPTATIDLAEGLLAAAGPLAAGTLAPGTYHLAGTGATTWFDFAGAILARAGAHTGRQPEIVPITTADYPTPARRPANSELSSALFAQAAGFRAAPWQQRVVEVVDQLVGSPAT